jgi:hypothetical protein
MSTFLVAGLAAAAAGLLAARRRTVPPGTQARALGRKGLPIAAIARRTGLSQDAVRAALGQAARGRHWTGSFFRPRAASAAERPLDLA